MTTLKPHRLALSCPSHRTYHTLTRFTLDSGSYMVSSHSTHMYMDSYVTLGKWHPDPRDLVSGKGLVHLCNMEKHAPRVLLIPVWTITSRRGSDGGRNANDPDHRAVGDKKPCLRIAGDSVGFLTCTENLAGWGRSL